MNNQHELYHHGIKGQKWGIRRFRNEDGTLTDRGKKRYAENYSSEQRARDQRIYSKGAVRRINKKMLKGEGIQGARSAEAGRINSHRKAAENAGHIGGTVGAVGGAIGGALLGVRLSGSTKVHSMLRSAGLSDVAITSVNLAMAGAIGAGASKVGQSLGRIGGQSAAMLVGGYKPSKYRD